jgi:competence protein ComEC
MAKQSSKASREKQNSKKQSGRGQAVAARASLLSVIMIVVLAGVFYFGGMDPHEVLNWAQQELTQLPDEGNIQQETPQAAAPTATPAASPIKEQREADISRVLPREGMLNVVAIDVGQGDSIFIRTPGGRNMLVDAGEKSEFQAVDAYLTEAGIKKLDAVVCTHPHSDHIGAMEQIVEKYDVAAVYMPKVEHTTRTYLNLLQTIKDKGLKIKGLKGGKKTYISLDDSVEIRVLGPLEKAEYSDLNHYSLVLRISYGEYAVMLTGDAEKINESEMLETFSSQELRSDVLKVGHHGSSTSSSAAFLDAVNASTALITVAEHNDYNHPDQETLRRLQERGAEIYRSDESGTIAVYIGEEGIEVAQERG